MPNSVLDAIKMGLWNFEPDAAGDDHFDSTEALPGSKEKLDVLAERVRRGLPLWHHEDRVDCEDLAEELWPR